MCCAKLVVIYILPTNTTNKQFVVFGGNIQGGSNMTGTVYTCKHV